MMTQSPANPDLAAPARILALDMHMSHLADLPAGVVALAGFAELDARLLAQVRPDQILMPLLSSGHDAFAVVERLQTIGYTGLITVVALHLPNARMVETELRALGPGKRLALLTP